MKTLTGYLLEHRAVILVPPDEDLCDGANGLHKKVPVVVCHCGVFSQDVVHVPDVWKKAVNAQLSFKL